MLDTSECVAELRQHELVMPDVIACVEAQRCATEGPGLALGLGRYLFHLPTLKGARKPGQAIALP